MKIYTNIIILYADSLRRDFSTCYILSEQLKKDGYKIFICSRRNFKHFLKFLLPSKIFVIGQVDVLENFLGAREIKLPKEIFFMPSEGFVSDREYPFMYPESFNYSILKKIFFWGKCSREWFIKNRGSITNNQTPCLGYARMPIAFKYEKMVKRDFDKIGFIGRFPAINDLYKRSLIDLYFTDTRKDNLIQLSARQEAESLTIGAYIELWECIVKSSNKKISFRPHPNEDATSYKKIEKKYPGRFSVDRTIDVAEWMAGCSKVVSLASSSFVDAYLTKTPVICVDNYLGITESTLVYDPGLKTMYGACVLPNTFEETLDSILNDDIKLNYTNEFYENIQKNFIGESSNIFDDLHHSIKGGDKSGFIDYAVVYLLNVIDFFLVFRKLFTQKQSLQFDYTPVFHKASKNLRSISKSI